MTDYLRKMDVGVGVKANWAEINKLQASLSKIKASMSQIAKIDVNKTTAKATEQSKKHTDAVEKETQTTKKQAKETEKLAKEQSEAAKQTQTVGKKASRASQGFDKLTQAQQKAVMAGKHITTINKRLEKVAKATRGITLAVGAGAAYGIKKSMDLQDIEKRTTNLLVTGGEKRAEAQRNVNKMQSDGAELSKKYGKSQSEIANGYQELVKRGYDSNQALGAQKSLLQASVASGDSYADVVQGATTALESFGMRTKSTSGMLANTKTVVNQLAYAADMTATDFHGISKAMEYVGTSAHQSGFSLHETAAAIGELSNYGLEADKAGTGLRKMIVSLQSPGKQAATQMDKLKISTEDFVANNGKMKSLTDIMGILADKTKGMGKAEKGAVFHNLFGTTGQQAGMILAQSTKELAKLDKQVAKSQKKNYVQNLADKNMKTTKAQWERLKQSAQAVAITFGTVVLPPLTKVMDKLAHVADSLSKMPKSAQGMVTAGALIVGAIYPATKAAQGLLRTIKTFDNIKSFGLLNTVMGRTGTKALPKTTTGAPTTISPVSSPVTESAVKGSSSFAYKAMTGLAFGGSLVTGGLQIAQGFKDGIDSKKGGSEIWAGGGEAIGGALGAFWGPAGVAIGSAAGELIGKVAAKTVSGLQKSDGYSDQYKQNQKADRQKKQLRNKYYANSSGNPDIDNANKVLNQSGVTALNKNSKSYYNPKQSKVYTDEFSELTKSAKRAASSSSAIIQKANSTWVKGTVGSTKKAANSNVKVYSQMYRDMASYTKKQERETKIATNWLKQHNLISSKQAKSSVTSETKTGKKRLTALQKALSALEKDEKAGGKHRESLLKQVNKAEVAILTDGGKDQKRVLAKINRQNGTLSKKSFNSIVSNANKSYKSQVSLAKRTLNAKKSSAESDYKSALKYAKKIYGVHSNQYKNVKEKADAQRKAVEAAAQDQYEKVKKKAEDQRDAVVNASESAAATVLKVAGATISDLNSRLSKVGLGHSDKTPKLETTLTNKYNDPIKGNQKTKKGGSPSTDAKLQLPVQGIGHANGGPINRNHLALVGEQDPELAYNTRTSRYRLLGANGPQLMQVYAGEHILNARDTKKALNGGIGKGKTLAGYAHAAGTAKLKTTSVKGKKQDTLNVDMKGSDKKSAKKSQDTYTSMVKTILKYLTKLVSGNSKSWKENDKVAKSKSGSIKKNVVGNYSNYTKQASKKQSGLQSNNYKSWRQMDKDTGKFSNSIRKNTLSDFKSLGSGLHKENNSINKQWNSDWTGITKDFNTIFSRLSGYAHSGMAGAIKQLNSGLSGINTTLGQFGGNKSVLKPIHYATGTGPVAAGHAAMVNDAQTGPRQEAVVKANGDVHIPHGLNRMVRLEKGDSVLNGSDFEAAQRAGAIPHYAKGKNSKDALRKLIETNNKDPQKAFKNEYSDKISAQGSVLQKGLTNIAKAGSPSVGNPWSSEAWSQFNNALSDGAAGGSWLHNPGLSHTDSFGSARGNGTHDGNDFSGPQGTAIKAVHGGKVIRAANPPGGWGAVGYSIITKGDDGEYVMYQEFGHANNAKVGVGDVVKTGQTVATLGNSGLGTGPHVHIGVSRNYPFSNRGTTTAGWQDLMKMHSKSTGTDKTSEKKKSGLSKYVSKQLKSQIKWIGKNLAEEDLGNFSLAGGIGSRAKQLADAIKKLYPAATDAGIAGVLGNWVQESRLDPSAINSGDHGSGLAQWTFERETRMRNWLKKHHYAWNSAAGQLDWALHEPGMNGMLKSVLRMTNPTQAAQKFFATWESGGNMDATGGTRRNNASAVYKAIKGREHGGAVRKGETYLVDEKGIEQYSPDAKLWKAPANGSIKPHDQTKQAIRSRSKGDIKITQNITINAEGNQKADIYKLSKQGVDDANEKLFEMFLEYIGSNDEGGIII